MYLQDRLWKEYVKARVDRGISMENLALDTPKARAYKERDKQELRETRLVPYGVFPHVNIEINVYGNRIMWMSFTPDNAYAVIMHDEFFTKMWTANWQMLWEKYAKTLDTAVSVA